MSENSDKNIPVAAEAKPVKRTVLDAEDVIELVPKLKGHEKLVNRVLHWLDVDKVNDVHSRGFDHPSLPFQTIPSARSTAYRSSIW